MIYLLIIILLFSGSVANDFGKPKKLRTQLYWLCCFIMICTTGFRDGLGGDTANYMKLWISIPDITHITSAYIGQSRYQPGFLLIFSLIKTITDEYFVFQLIHGAFINITVFWFFKKYSTAPFLCALIFFVLNYMEFNMEIVRESVAVCFGLLAYNSYVKNKWRKTIVFLLCAFLFHISSIILLIVPICLRAKYSRTILLRLIGAIVAVYVIFPMLPDFTIYLSYLTSDPQAVLEQYDTRTVNASLNFNFFIIHAIKSIILPGWAILQLKNKSNFLLGLAIAYIVLYSMSTFTYAFYRFANYFAPFYIVMLAMAIREFFRKAVEARFRPVILAAFMTIFLYCYQSVQLQSDSKNGGHLYNRYIPYKSVLF